jgi:hypothetical protein
MELYNHVVKWDLIPKRYRLSLPSIEVFPLLSGKKVFLLTFTISADKQGYYVACTVLCNFT